MYEQMEKPQRSNSRAIANSVTQKKSNVKQGFGFVDNRPEYVRQCKLIKNIGNRKPGAEYESVSHYNNSYDNQKNAIIQPKFYEWNPSGETDDEKHIWHWGPVIPSLWAKKEGDEGQEKWNGYGVWLRKGTKAHLEQVMKIPTVITPLLEEVKEQYDVLSQRIGSREEVTAELKHAYDITNKYVDQLGIALQKYAGITVIGIGVSVGVAALAEHFLSLPGVPIAVKAAIDIAGILYGAYVTYRWMKTDLLPVIARSILVTGNAAIWSTTVYSILKEGLNGSWFSSVHIAALPLAMSIEYMIRRLMGKVETMMVQSQASTGV